MKNLRALVAPAAAFAIASLIAPHAAAEETRETSDVRVVRPRSETGVVVGGVLIVGGGFGVLGGGALAVVGAAWAGQDCSFSTGDARAHCEDLRGQGPGLRTLGIVSLAAGAVLAVSGLYLAIHSAHADVAPARPIDAFLRVPTWSHADIEAAPAPLVPLAGGAF